MKNSVHRNPRVLYCAAVYAAVNIFLRIIKGANRGTEVSGQVCETPGFELNAVLDGA